MKYVVKAIEEQSWTVWYLVEAESGDEAKSKVYGGEWDEELDNEYNETTYKEVIEMEPYNETN